MNIYILFILIISLIGIKFTNKEFNQGYLNFTSTNCVKGIFLLLVFLSHALSYIKVNHWYDKIALFVQSHLGQLIVVLFFFYSGYGIYESIKKKKDYIKNFPKKRIAKTLIMFDFAVLLYFLVSIFIKSDITINQFMLSLIGWKSVGNSNWFIFDTLVLYCIVYICFKGFSKDQARKLTYIFTIIFILFLTIYKQSWWYNTLICFPLGMSYSHHKEKIEKLAMKSNYSYYVLLFLFIVSLYTLYFISKNSLLFYELWAAVFTILIVLITMKIDLKSPILNWMGKNLFWLYILQRIPMILLTYFHYNVTNPYRFFALSFIITIVLTYVISLVFNKITRKVFN